jgi:hypothetical protein
MGGRLLTTQEKSIVARKKEPTQADPDQPKSELPDLRRRRGRPTNAERLRREMEESTAVAAAKAKKPSLSSILPASDIMTGLGLQSKRGRKPKDAEALPDPVRPAIVEQAVHEEERAKAEASGRKVIEPNPGPQTEFLQADERQVLYGGAAGGGKSFAMVIDALRYCAYSDYRAVLFRKTLDELRQIITESKKIYPMVYPGAQFNVQEKTWKFPSGAEIWFAYLDKDDDIDRFFGLEFQWIGFDELTHWPTPNAWNLMASRLRTSNPNIKLYQRASTNPGGVGNHWVKKMFIDPAAPNTRFAATGEDGKPMVYPAGHPKAGKPLFYRRFIPASLYDNPYLMASGDYEATLLGMPEHMRRRLLHGDWDIVEGAAFVEFDRSIHVCDPFEIPRHWPRFRACDWGYSTKAACLWFAVDPNECVYVYRELITSKVTADEFARQIRALEAGEHIRYGVLDNSCWQVRSGSLTEAEMMRNEGIIWRPAHKAQGSRVAGKMEIHRRLKVQGDGNPLIRIFSSCPYLARTLPTLPLDKGNPEDVDTNHPDDHAYDALRYFLSSRPTAHSGGIAPSQYRPVDPVFGY